MNINELYSVLSGAYGEVLDGVVMWQCIAALGVKPIKDGNQWCFLYGENLQEGICGFGDTIQDAAYNFYNEIRKSKLTT